MQTNIAAEFNGEERKGNSLKLRDKLAVPLHDSTGIGDELVHDGLGGLLLVNDSGDLAHQERTGVVEGIIIDVIREVLHIVLDGDDTLGGELLDFLGAVLLPVLNVGVVADAERAAGEDNGADVVIKA